MNRDPILDDRIPRALHRSRYTPRVLIALHRHGELTIHALSRKIRLRPARTMALLRGEPPAFSTRLAPARLGLVRTRREAHGIVVRLTPLGRRVAVKIVLGRTY